MADLSRWLDRVVQGDCLDVLRELPDCSVELCATDPPFGISFMSSDWDRDIPARAIWAEVLRVLKPGASCFVCAGSRQDTILGMLTDLREVGFDIQHASLTWAYATGFPKSTDCGKDMDKAAFLAWVQEQPLTVLPECPWEHKHKAFTKRGVECPECRRRVWALQAGYSNEVTRADVRKAASAAVNGCYSGDMPQISPRESEGVCDGRYDPAKKASHGTLLLTALQARFGDAPGVRQKVGKSTRCVGPSQTISAYGFGASDNPEESNNITSPATPEAIEWDGWHSSSVALKPSAESVLWVTKPAEPGPARLNVLKWGTGAVNVGECRVPTDETLGGSGAACMTFGGANARPYQQDFVAPGANQHPSGRYPSNLLVSSRALGDDSKYGDIDAWSQARGLSPEWLDVALSAGVLRVPKPARSEKNAGLDERCSHPTCKPVTLMAFLCVLACPRGGTVLDPFLGSGTTAVAAVSCGMHFIGIEREAEYVQIAEARVAHAFEQTRLGGLFAALEAAE